MTLDDARKAAALIEARDSLADWLDTFEKRKEPLLRIDLTFVEEDRSTEQGFDEDRNLVPRDIVAAMLRAGVSAVDAELRKLGVEEEMSHDTAGATDRAAELDCGQP